jgi:hypothetical protein
MVGQGFLEAAVQPGLPVIFVNQLLNLFFVHFARRWGYTAPERIRNPDAGGALSEVSGTESRAQEKASAVGRTAQENAEASARTVQEKASDDAGTARQEASRVVGETSAQAQDLVGRLKGQVGEQASGQTHNLAENIRRLASELRAMSENGKPDSPATSIVRQVADQGETIADRLEHRGPDGLVNDLQGFARRRPGLFLAGAALAGFAVSRLTKGVSAAGDGGSGGDGTSAQRPRTYQEEGISADPMVTPPPAYPPHDPVEPTGRPVTPGEGV